MQQDIRAYDEAKKAIADGEELVPSELVYAILDGANPVFVQGGVAHSPTPPIQ